MRKKNCVAISYTFIKDNKRTNTSGPVIPMENFFKKKTLNFILLEQPLPGSQFNYGLISHWYNKKKVREIKIFPPFFSKNIKNLNSNKTYLSLKIRDLYFNIILIFYIKFKVKLKKIDFLISLECLNTSFFLIFKKILNIQYVFYYIFDWSPKRYNSSLNRIYLKLDKFCTYFSSATWNITYAINQYKIKKMKFNKKKISRQIYVPYSPYFKKNLIKKKWDPNKIIFSGGLIKENGARNLIPIFKKIHEKNRKIKLIILGDGEEKKFMEKQAIKYNLEKKIKFYGYISNQNKIIEIQSECALGLAPYPNTIETRKRFGDVIKIRMYFASCLPTISTNVPPVYKEIETEKLGSVVKSNNYNIFAKAAIELLSNKALLSKTRKNVFKKAQNSSWEKTYSRALKESTITQKETS